MTGNRVMNVMSFMSSMKKGTVITLGICALMLSSVAHSGRGWTETAKVLELIPTGRHYYEVQLSEKENPSGCREKGWYYLNYNAAGADKMFDLFVDNIKSNLRLKVYVTGLCNLKGYAEISAVSASPN